MQKKILADIEEGRMVDYEKRMEFSQITLLKAIFYFSWSNCLELNAGKAERGKIPDLPKNSTSRTPGGSQESSHRHPKTVPERPTLGTSGAIFYYPGP